MVALIEVGYGDRDQGSCSCSGCLSNREQETGSAYIKDQISENVWC